MSNVGRVGSVVLPRPAVRVGNGANTALVDAPNSRQRLTTPALVLDLDAFEANIARMAKIGQDSGLALRPHAKTHKCSQIALRQIDAGAVGVCCATTAEAAAMAAAGVRGIHVTSPAVGDSKIGQLVDVGRRNDGVMVVVDHEANLRDLSRAANSARITVDVLVDIDPGMNRTGVVHDDDAGLLARLAADLPNVRYRGLQCYFGNIQHIVDFEDRRAAVDRIGGRVRRLRRELAAAGLEPQIVSGGGTGSAGIETSETFTELQVGSYIFMDVEYCGVLMKDGSRLPYVPSLFVASTVVNSHRSMQSTIDAGTKALVRGWSNPVLTRPEESQIDYEFSGDEHGRLVYRNKTNRHLVPGDKVELLTPHCDPTVDLYAFYHCVRGDILVDIWEIDARSIR